MRIAVAAAAVAAGLFVTSCGTPQTEKPPAATRAAPPAYEVINVNESGPVGSADLLMPKARPASSEAAIRDYADRFDSSGLAAYSVIVTRARDAATFVCRGEWRADDRAAQLYGAAPGLSVECPDPKPLD